MLNLEQGLYNFMVDISLDSLLMITKNKQPDILMTNMTYCSVQFSQLFQQSLIQGGHLGRGQHYFRKMYITGQWAHIIAMYFNAPQRFFYPVASSRPTLSLQADTSLPRAASCCRNWRVFATPHLTCASIIISCHCHHHQHHQEIVDAIVTIIALS